mmetsp:Transcript_19474/g.73609  ORF Transcript_19474/g.73609 Transcript_19474/m.73609 type:complete len:344 (-) Transcript_19474:889-1920(-)
MSLRTPMFTNIFFAMPSGSSRERKKALSIVFWQSSARYCIRWTYGDHSTDPCATLMWTCVAAILVMSELRWVMASVRSSVDFSKVMPTSWRCAICVSTTLFIFSFAVGLASSSSLWDRYLTLTTDILRRICWASEGVPKSRMFRTVANMTFGWTCACFERFKRFAWHSKFACFEKIATGWTGRLPSMNMRMVEPKPLASTKLSGSVSATSSTDAVRKLICALTFGRAWLLLVIAGVSNFGAGSSHPATCLMYSMSELRKVHRSRSRSTLTSASPAASSQNDGPLGALPSYFTRSLARTSATSPSPSSMPLCSSCGSSNPSPSRKPIFDRSPAAVRTCSSLKLT